MADSGRWIMLTRKPPTKPSPAKFSLFWSLPAPNPNVMVSQQERYYDENDHKYYDWSRSGGYDPENLPDEFVDLFGLDSNAEKWRKITFMGRDIVLQPHEFAFKDANSMRELLFKIPEDNHGLQMYELVENNEASRLMLDVAMDTDLRNLYDAALLDGCTDLMARMVAMGQDISEEMWEWPPIGYYRPILGVGYFEYFADVGEPLTSRRNPDEYWMLRETPPFTEAELIEIGRGQSEYEERERSILERDLMSIEDMDAMADDILGEEDEG